jgi:GNAT superfamily N-acetyltransferase
MAIEIREVAGRRMRHQFIHLPAKIHRGHANWVPPLYMDERAFFNPLKNKSYGYSDVILLLAIRDKRPVGRIMGLINRRYNELKGEKHARFCFLECRDDPEVSSALISAVEDWARKRGMVKLVGPLGFSDKDPQGLLVEGFDKPHVIATTCNYPYLPRLVEACGFFKEVDLVVYKLDVPREIPEIYSMANERILSRNSIVLREFERRKELKPYIRPALQLMNETYVDIYGFDPLTEKEMDELAARYIPLLDPRFVKVVETDRGKVVGFFICMPDLSTGIKKSRGYLLPIGIIHIIRAGKKTKQMNLLLAGIDKDWRGQGLDALMGTSMIKAAHKAGLEYIDSHLMLEHNVKVRAEMERMGGVIYKRFRIFQKPILM